MAGVYLPFFPVAGGREREEGEEKWTQDMSLIVVACTRKIHSPFGKPTVKVPQSWTRKGSERVRRTPESLAIQTEVLTLEKDDSVLLLYPDTGMSHRGLVKTFDRGRGPVLYLLLTLSCCNFVVNDPNHNNELTKTTLLGTLCTYTTRFLAGGTHDQQSPRWPQSSAMPTMTGRGACVCQRCP